MDVQTRNRVAAGMLVVDVGCTLVFFASRALSRVMCEMMRAMMKEMMTGDNGLGPPEM
jgi:hypothetical protein